MWFLTVWSRTFSKFTDGSLALALGTDCDNAQVRAGRGAPGYYVTDLSRVGPGTCPVGRSERRRQWAVRGLGSCRARDRDPAGLCRRPRVAVSLSLDRYWGRAAGR